MFQKAGPPKLAALLLLCLILPSAMPQEDPEENTDGEIKPRLPALSSIYPQGSQPGAKLRVEVLGQYLDRAQSVLFLDSSIRGRVVSGSHTALQLDLEVDANAPFGPHYFRVVSPRGASNILLFRVGDQPHILEKEPNTSLQEAQPVAIPATLNGRLNVDGDFDFFRFRAEKGQTWIFDLRSARNGSGLDPALILLDARGRKLDHSEENFIWDPFLVQTFPETGDYYAVVQPTHVRLDPTFAYQLDIRQAPHLDTIAPISLRPGATAEATIYGAGLSAAVQPVRLWFDAIGFSGEVLELRDSTARVKIQVPESAPNGPRELALTTKAGRSNPATFLVDSTPVHSGGDVIQPPVSITGIARYREPERFSFDVKEKQKLLFEVRAQRFGSPVDATVRILDEKGKQVAFNDDGTFPGTQFNKDSRLVHTFENAGRYTVELRNLYKTTGEANPYQLIVREPVPEVELMLASDNPYVYAGGEGKLKITAVRRDGQEGAIPLEVSGLPPGITAHPAEIAEGKNEADLRFTADAGAPPGTHGQIRITAKQAAAPARRSVRIASGGGEGATFGTVHEATLAIVEKPQFSLEAAVTTVNLVKGGTAEFQVTIKRAAGFSEPIRFSLENLPKGVTAAESVAAAEASSVKIELRAADNVQTGRVPRVAILGRAQSGEVQDAPRIALVID